MGVFEALGLGFLAGVNVCMLYFELKKLYDNYYEEEDDGE